MTKYCCIDTETTGLISTKNNLLSACFIILDNNFKELDRLNIFVKYSEYTINIKALEVNKINIISHHNNSITTNIIDSNKILHDFLKKNKSEWRFIPIYHNSLFDISFIQNSGLLPKNEYDDYFSYIPIDTLTIAQYFKSCKKLPSTQAISLVALSKYFNLYDLNDTNNFHTAEYDAEITIKLLKRFNELNTEIKHSSKKRKLN